MKSKQSNCLNNAAPSACSRIMMTKRLVSWRFLSCLMLTNELFWAYIVLKSKGMISLTRSVFLPYAGFYPPDCCKHSRSKAEDNQWVPGSVQCSKLRRVRKPPGSFQSNNHEQCTNTIARNMYVVKLSLHRSEATLLCRYFFPSRGPTFTHCSNHSITY